MSGDVSINNSLIGKPLDFVGLGGITELRGVFSGCYVISSPFWDSTFAENVGAVTWGGLGGPLGGTVSATNSLVGFKAEDQVGLQVVALSNGHYVVASPIWDGARGAVTWVSGNTGLIGTVAAGNSMVGTSPQDRVGNHISPLSNGNYVITSPFWDKGLIQDVGAVTLGPAFGTTGTVSAIN